MVYEAGGALQTADFADQQEAARAAADLDAVLFLLHDHHATEEKYVFPKLRPFEERLVDAMLVQHRRGRPPAGHRRRGADAGHGRGRGRPRGGGR